VNKVILMGRLARDPACDMTQSGKKKARMTIAVDRRISRANAQPGQQTADFIGLVAWEKTAEFSEQYLHKGTRILVEGRIQTGSYEKDGVKRYTTDVICERIEFADSKTQSGTQNDVPDDVPGGAVDGGENDGDDDIPF